MSANGVARLSSVRSQPLTLARRFQTPEQQRQQGVDPRCELWIAPFLGMGGMMEAAGGVKNRARRGFDVGDMECALLHAIGQNMRELIAEAFLMRLHHLTRRLR